uniref:Uncharacterized protein n=1 Tax=Arundo donax TaxID=35708 RepID=A0A0A8ZL05_ARUDO
MILSHKIWLLLATIHFPKITVTNCYWHVN